MVLIGVSLVVDMVARVRFQALIVTRPLLWHTQLPTMKALLQVLFSAHNTIWMKVMAVCRADRLGLIVQRPTFANSEGHYREHDISA